ncbi:MAG: CsgG/HfaB family protein [Rhodanobacter thiooxydans]|nr:CsgG/HfaB family protein [Rhodanobacter thiooxydans]EIL98667.1 hypothetical protein UUA_11056 [Rhodanobacter thiooxydans LCS2]MCW0202694.1 CsgG/HfaB family protein [Rhodanobacter thiooxydans]
MLAEQDLAASHRMRPGSSPHTGNVTGAQYLVTGSVAGYTEDTSHTGGVLNIAGFRVGGGKSEAYVAIDLRVIDAETSEVVYSRTVEGRSSSGGVDLRGYVSGGYGDFATRRRPRPARRCARR